MSPKRKNAVCPVERAGALDSGIRRMIQNPEKILGPYIRGGMTVCDLGCGPGFFTLPIARLVGEKGTVIAADLQKGMLDIVRKKARAAGLDRRIIFHECAHDRIGLKRKPDLIVMFYVFHEFPDRMASAKEIYSILKPGGGVIVVEPKFHVSKRDFIESLDILRDAGFMIGDGPKVFFSRSAVVSKR
jgi:ubiquinone/menaquinone biosynthesis C-methylase UbiE